MTTISCLEFRTEIESYLSDRIEGIDLVEFRGHLGACRPCRGELERRDASMLFARLAEEPKDREDRGAGADAAERAEFLASVKRGISIERTRRRASRHHFRPRWFRLAAAIGVIGLVGILAILSRSGSSPATPVSQEAAVVRAAPRSEVALARVSAPIEDLDRGDARIYHLDTGGTDDDPQVVLIVDRGMDI